MCDLDFLPAGEGMGEEEAVLQRTGPPAAPLSSEEQDASSFFPGLEQRQNETEAGEKGELVIHADMSAGAETRERLGLFFKGK